MTDPAEIIANTIFRADAWRGDERRHQLYLAQARKAVEALDAAGFTIIAPDNRVLMPNAS